MTFPSDDPVWLLPNDELAALWGVSKRTVGRRRRAAGAPRYERSYPPPRPPKPRATVRTEKAIAQRLRRAHLKEQGIRDGDVARHIRKENQRQRRLKIKSVELLLDKADRADLDFIADDVGMNRTETMRYLIRLTAKLIRKEL